ncbi:uncharacterized protein SPSK_01307 [Sporothrix schenckii 1099-18]|uniref:Uncharacterized protein n=2 Tax=Sporothrix schenckii TaxID=29908 RepID=U7PP42_SPOS1|nr:uncharacterized protein SPSK_01307 [Sporothrix schenckii 1099-18]ERS96711.1 hypothetical protein HMPREF1624_06920 [Sporothrix schenckii ATCC 58251]KJR81432.1 hypothetical protein SPSK_01307 [Sporothrix schenckii 1099-18]
MATDAVYTGPSVGTMINTHTLASEIIARHGTGAEAVLDDDNISQLRRYLDAPDSEKRAVLAKAGTDDLDTALAKVREGGYTLVDYAALTRGSAKAAFTDDEEAALRSWLQGGGGAPQDN